jgi:molecular chaperone HtpG
MREDLFSPLKILKTSAKHPQLNAFEMFLGLSEKMIRREGDFFRYPHTTKIIWAGHRIVYIFTEASGKITLYYDIELREPLEEKTAGGGMFPTTTLVLKNRIYVPVPKPLESAFKLVDGVKEFFVRFDAIMTADLGTSAI